MNYLEPYYLIFLFYINKVFLYYSLLVTYLFSFEMGGLGDIVEKIVNISNFYSNKENRDWALNYVRNNDVTKLDESRIGTLG